MDADIQQGLDTLLKAIGKEKKITTESLSGLHFIFGSVLEGALELIDTKAVQVIQSKPSERTFYSFINSASEGDKYFCFDHYCSCPAFKIAVVSKENTLACKHQLAAWIVHELGDTYKERQEISDYEYSQHLFGDLSAV